MIGVGVPRLEVAIIDLREANASLCKASGKQAAVAKLARPIFLAHFFCFAIEIKGVAGFKLHAKSRFQRLDTGIQKHVFGAGCQMLSIERSQHVELTPLGKSIQRTVSQKWNHLARIQVRMIDVGSLEFGRQKRAVP